MRERLHIFAGPSLPPLIRPGGANLAWRPPAQAGDLLALLDQPPARLCLIDGVFDARPAVWHKEILLLLSAGWRVFGAASIGALRAAELERYGVVGVGAIHRVYASGRITGDDEVALVHAPEALGWAPLSEPLVEVRASLAAAVRRRTVTKVAARALLDAAKSIHFADRTWPAIFAAADSTFCDAVIPVRLKTIDALQCLIAAQAETGPSGCYPVPPITCFVSALASEIGCDAISLKRS